MSGNYYGRGLIWIAAVGVSNDFTPDGVLLEIKSERDNQSGKFGIGYSCKI